MHFRRCLSTGTFVAGIFSGLCALGVVTVSVASAEEIVVASLDGQRKFAPLWPGGTFEQGVDASLPYARVVTDGKAGGTFIANIRPYRPTIDARGKFIKIWVKVDELARLGGMEFRVSSDRFATNYYAFGLSMYDDDDFNIVRDGVWTTLTFSFGTARKEGEPNRGKINSIGWYVADKGNDAPLTAHWGGMALVDEPSEGVLSITFDDGYDEHLLAAQLMAKHGFAGTAYIIPGSIGEQGYLTAHQLVDMQETYHWDIASHHQTPFTEMRPDELESTILGVQRYLVQNAFPDGAGHLAYPLGKQNTFLVRPLVRKHFATARVAAHGPETLPPADPHLLRVLNVTQDTTPEQIGAAARRAREDKEWLILMLHYLVEKPENDLEYSVEGFKKMLVEIERSKIRVLPLARVWAGCSLGGQCDFESVVAAPQP